MVRLDEPALILGVYMERVKMLTDPGRRPEFLHFGVVFDVALARRDGFAGAAGGAADFVAGFAVGGGRHGGGCVDVEEKGGEGGAEGWGWYGGRFVDVVGGMGRRDVGNIYWGV